MQSPLLASDDDGHGTPSLSAGPAVTEETEFARLIGQKSPLDALGERFEGNAADDYVLLGLDPSDLTQDASKLLVAPPRGPLTTAIAGSLSVLHLAFVWASYSADVWAESRIRVSLEWQEEFLPLLNDAKETVVRSTNLMSLLQDLGDSKNYVLMLMLWVVSLLIPCAFMIVSPTFVLADHVRPIIFAQRTRVWNGRGVLEVSMRWALMTFYVVILLSLATSFLELQWTDTKIEAGNRACGPLAAYVVGVASAIGLAVLLRSPTTKENVMMAASPNHESPEIEPIRSPPPQAFQDPWRPPAVEEDEPAMVVLEEVPIPTTPSTPSTPDLISERDAEEEEQEGLPFWCKFVAFQLGLLSVLLWVPSYNLSALHFSYGGIATNFLAEPVLKLFIWEIPETLWQQGVNFGTPIWILILTGSVLILTAYVLPILATCLGVLAWLGDGKWSTKSYAWLFALHPALGGLVFGLSLVAVMQALSPFSESLLDHETSGICSKFNDITGEACLVVTARLLPGAWFYLFQSVVLELFVWVTLRWG